MHMLRGRCLEHPEPLQFFRVFTERVYHKISRSPKKKMRSVDDTLTDKYTQMEGEGRSHCIFSSPCSPCPVIIMWSANVGLGVRWEGSTDLRKKVLWQVLHEELGLCFTHPVLSPHWVLCEMLQSLGFSSKSSKWEWGRGWRFKWSKTGHEQITAEARLWAYESLSWYPFLSYIC